MREPNRISHYEISEKHRKLRWVLVAILFLIGMIALGIGFMGLLNRDTGWQEIQVVTEDANCSPEFVLQYNLSGSGAEATGMYKEVSAVYTEACVKAYQLFQVDISSDTYENVYDINHSVGQVLTVDPVLYAAFEKLQDTRYLYLGPVYAHYNSLIFNTSQEYVAELDPAVSAEAAEYIAALTAFAADADAVQLQLLGENRVQLMVSQEYLAFAQENEIENFIDFRYFTNAFIIDYLADCLVEKGYTRGFLSSCDGYTRNLDSQEQFSYNIHHRVENTIYPVGTMNYRGPVSMVFLKDFTLTNSDAYYRESSGHIVHTHVDPADGMYKASIPAWVGYSYEESCVDVLLKMIPIFASNNFTVPEGIYSVWCEGNTVFYNDPAITVGNLLTGEGISYSAQLVQ